MSWFPFDKKDNPFQGSILGSPDIPGEHRVKWYLVEDKEFIPRIMKAPIKNVPSENFVPDLKKINQIDTEGTLIYPEDRLYTGKAPILLRDIVVKLKDRIKQLEERVTLLEKKVNV